MINTYVNHLISVIYKISQCNESDIFVQIDLSVFIYAMDRHKKENFDIKSSQYFLLFYGTVHCSVHENRFTEAILMRCHNV